MLPDYCFVAHSQMDPTPTYRLQSNVFFTRLTAAGEHSCEKFKGVKENDFTVRALQEKNSDLYALCQNLPRMLKKPLKTLKARMKLVSKIALHQAFIV